MTKTFCKQNRQIHLYRDNHRYDLKLDQHYLIILRETISYSFVSYITLSLYKPILSVCMNGHQFS